MWDDNIQTEFDHETGGRLSMEPTTTTRTMVIRIQLCLKTV